MTRNKHAKHEFISFFNPWPETRATHKYISFFKSWPETSALVWLQDATYHTQSPQSKDHIISPLKQPITAWYFQFNQKTLLNMIHFLTVYSKLLYLNFKHFLQINSSCNTGHHTAKLCHIMYNTFNQHNSKLNVFIFALTLLEPIR